MLINDVIPSYYSCYWKLSLVNISHHRCSFKVIKLIFKNLPPIDLCGKHFTFIQSNLLERPPVYKDHLHIKDHFPLVPRAVFIYKFGCTHGTCVSVLLAHVAGPATQCCCNNLHYCITVPAPSSSCLL